MIKFESEKHLEDFITQQFNNDGLCIVDGEQYEHMERQFTAGLYGVVDLVFYSSYTAQDWNGLEIDRKVIHVIELKNEPMKLSHIAQLSRYKRYFDLAFEGANIELHYSLVVPESVSKSDDAKWLIDSLKDINVIEFTLDPINGIRFDRSIGWMKTDETYKDAMGIFDIGRGL